MKTQKVKIRKPTAPGTVKFKNRKNSAKADKTGRKTKHKKHEDK